MICKAAKEVYIILIKEHISIGKAGTFKYLQTKSTTDLKCVFALVFGTHRDYTFKGIPTN